MTDTTRLQRVLTDQLPGCVGQRVRLEGWVSAIRKFGAVNFLVLRDRSGLAQVILEPDQITKLEGLQVETVVSVEGTVEAEERASNGVEIRDAGLEVISPVSEVLPFEINKRFSSPHWMCT
jgi:nondiscriminating aspartyl-tRNA synthetase